MKEDKVKELVEITENFVIQVDSILIKNKSLMSSEEKIEFSRCRLELIESLSKLQNKDLDSQQLVDLKFSIWRIVDWFLKIIGMTGGLDS